MARERLSGLADYAESAPDTNMRFFADVANRRDMTLRDLAGILPNEQGGIGVYPSTVTRHMNALNSKPGTIARYEKALGLDTRLARVQRGSYALSEDDLKHYRRLLLRAIALSDDYAEPDEAKTRVAAALDGSRLKTQQEVLHSFAETYDVSVALRRLSRLTSMLSPQRVRMTTADMTFWSIALELKEFGLPPRAIQRVLKLIAKESSEPEAVRRNFEYLERSLYGALVVGDDERKAHARAVLRGDNEGREV